MDQMIAFLIAYMGGSVCGVDLAAKLIDVDEMVHMVTEHIRGLLGDAVEFLQIALLDSRKLLARHRDALVRAIRQFYEHYKGTKLLVPHGLATILETAAYLDNALGELLSIMTIVLVWSEKLPSDEATDTFKMIDAGVKALKDDAVPPGIHIIMADGSTLPWREVEFSDAGRLVRKTS